MKTEKQTECFKILTSNWKRWRCCYWPVPTIDGEWGWINRIVDDEEDDEDDDELFVDRNLSLTETEKK